MLQPTSSRQATSLLFSTPLEIRRAIYAKLINVAGIHIVRTEQGSLRLTACTGPDIYAGHIGDERRTIDKSFTPDSIWVRRLVSSWGPHWECEEIALGQTGEMNGDLSIRTRATWRDHCAVLSVCKQTYFEVMELMTEAVCFNITDMVTLDTLLPKMGSFPSSPYPSVPFAFKDSILPHVKELGIILRLPLSLFVAFDGSHEAAESSTPVNGDDLRIWSTLSTRFTQLKELRRVRIWLDHTNKAYWSVVNERAFLSQFETPHNNPSPEFSFDLPKLHPQVEDPQRHYTGDSTIGSSSTSLSPLNIRRILRQRYHGRNGLAGADYRIYAQDFPHCVGHPISKNMTIADMENWEKPLWRAGVDVEYILSCPYYG